MNWFLPSKTKKILAESELVYSSLQRNRVYSQDILSPRDLDHVLSIEKRYPPLIKARDVEALEKLNKEAMKIGQRLFPPSPWDGWRENVEVFVVAAIMALAIRTFFLQPFKIPTGSMEPTLLGIEPRPTTELPPSLPYQIYDFLIHGRTYSRVITHQGGKIVDLRPGSMTIWFEYTDVTLQDDQGRQETDRLWIRSSDVEEKLHLYIYGTPDFMDQHAHNEVYKPGDVLANYVTQTGDQVLVDKVTYNFRPPKPGEVIIFKTSGISGLANERGPDQEGSEDFIKRCVALAGDTVKVQPPYLYVNDKLAQGAPSFEKEFNRTDGYPGYTLVLPFECSGVTENTNSPYSPFDSQNIQTYYVTAGYWAMGDNSPNSKDSRYWGYVPRQNLVGRGYFVFWPFTKRWGWIR
ncbi:MAG TPA: signal peptidase I [Candidatus Methylacidiphilales bacterium]|nr:signal peptidase I [Candidatus Methylacidiphilales bacterium]